MHAWYLLQSKPQQERLALENLERQHYRTYLPRIRSRRRRKGRYATVLEPMFPRYIFIHLSDQSDDWGPIRSTIGVANLVRFGMTPARVPGDLILALREREDEEGVQRLPPADFRRGDRVRIVEGPMAGYEAIFEARSSSERVYLLLELADRTARVQVSGDDIEPVTRDLSVPGPSNR